MTHIQLEVPARKTLAHTRNNQKKVSIFTLGCKVNQYESDAMADQFKHAGYQVLPYDDLCDYYIINTCTVTSVSDRKSRQFMRRARKRNPQAVIVVVGCYSQVAPDQVEAIEEVNLVLGTNEKKDILQYIEGVTSDSKVVHVQEIMKTKTYEELEIEDTIDKTRVFMKIQEGCNQFCSYCIIPYARGPIRSRQVASIIGEAKRLAAKGFKELVLTGIHLSSYGLDLGNTSLIEVIEDLNKIEGLERIRLGSLEPKVITEDFMNRLKELDKFCPHFHLSLQSGCDPILKTMNRKYTTSDYQDGVDKIRAVYPQAAVTTDIIVGFPGESDDHFQTTLDYVKAIAFSQVHVFKYSPREGTPAASMKNQIHGSIKTERSHALEVLVGKLEDAYYQSFVGKTVRVLIEEMKEDYVEGLTPEYLRVRLAKESYSVNDIVDVEIMGYQDKKLLAKGINCESNC